MPNYDFVCLDCKQQFAVFVTFAEYGKQKVVCPNCRSEKIQRCIGRIRVARSDESHLEDLGDADNLDRLEDDPKAMGKMLRKMRSEIGEEAGPEFDEVVGRLESGQSPQEIEGSMPEFGNAMDSGLGDGGIPSSGMGNDDDL
jgi:putative FmdB family regulatory protein